MGTRCTNHVTPLYPQKLALTSPTGGDRSVGMVRSRTKSHGVFFSFLLHIAVSQISGSETQVLNKNVTLLVVEI